jgi:hypothetical protein
MPEFSVFFDALGKISGPLTFVAFLAIIAGAIYRWTIQDGRGYDLLQNRLGLDRRSYFRLTTLVIVLSFLLSVLALVIFIRPEGAELNILLGFVAFLSVLLIVFTSSLTKEFIPPGKELHFTGNVYWDDKGSSREGIVGAELRVAGEMGDWRTRSGGFFRISIPLLASRKKRYTITVIVSNPPGVKPKSITTSKTSGIVIKVPRPNPVARPHTKDPIGNPEFKTEQKVLQERYRSLQLHKMALESKKDELGRNFSAEDRAALLRVREDLRQLEKELRGVEQ